MAALALGAALAAGSAYAANQAAKSARNDINTGSRQSNALLTEGYNTAGNRLDTSYNTSRGYVDPYVQGGQRYQQMYDDLMGLNGDEARARAQQIITSDPLWSGALAQSSNAAQRALNARGLGGSGTAALAGQRVLLENYQPMLGRYQQGGQQGLQAASMGADLSSRYGQQRSDLDYGHAQQRAGVATNRANALAASRPAEAQGYINAAGMFTAGMTPNIAGQSAYGNMAAGLGKGWDQLWGAGASATPNSYNPTALAPSPVTGRYPGPI